jgi:hypothetical protein
MSIISLMLEGRDYNRILVMLVVYESIQGTALKCASEG